MNKRYHIWIGVVMIAVAGGCAAPVARIVHRLPAALPVADDLGDLAVGEFRLTDGPGEGVAIQAAEMLRERLALTGEPTSDAATVRVDGLIAAAVTDTDTQRMTGHWNAETSDVDMAPVASLVRQADVTVHFMVHQADGSMVTAEIRRTYDSRSDPAVWGELGLNRSDDPMHVPDADVIVRQLLAEAVDRFVEMVRPLDVRVDVPMRWVGGPDAEDGLAAAEKGDFTAATAHFEAALSRRPDDGNLLFDLAVSAEAAGELEAALANYQAAAEISDGQDIEAVAGVERVGRIMRRLGLTQ